MLWPGQTDVVEMVDVVKINIEAKWKFGVMGAKR